MKPFVILPILITLTACGNAPPVVTAVDTLCTSTTRYHASEEQRNQFIQNQPLWQPLVDWLASFDKVRDGECLKPAKGL